MNFLDEYEKYTGCLEVPSLFNAWCGLSALSAAAQRKIWFEGGMIKVCPNLYVVMVAPAGLSGKTVSMSIVQEHLVQHVKGIKTSSDSITKEKVFDEMRDFMQTFNFVEPKGKILLHCSYTLFANEMSVLIKEDKGFADAITTLFDARDVFKHSTRGKGVTFVNNPYLNILGCTTPKWLSFNIQEDVLEGGLSARTIWLHSTSVSKRNPFPAITSEMREAKGKMILRLEQICQIGGAFKMTPQATDSYNLWYHDHYGPAETPRQPKDERMGGYHNRKRVHVMKVAMLIALSYKDELVINADDLDRALMLLKVTEPAIQEALRGVGQNQLAGPTATILDIVYTAGKNGIEQSLLLRMVGWNVGFNNFMEILASLQMQKMIQVDFDTTTRKAMVHYIGPEREK